MATSANRETQLFLLNLCSNTGTARHVIEDQNMWNHLEKHEETPVKWHTVKGHMRRGMVMRYCGNHPHPFLLLGHQVCFCKHVVHDELQDLHGRWVFRTLKFEKDVDKVGLHWFRKMNWKFS